MKIMSCGLPSHGDPFDKANICPACAVLICKHYVGVKKDRDHIKERAKKIGAYVWFGFDSNSSPEVWQPVIELRRIENARKLGGCKVGRARTQAEMFETSYLSVEDASE